jgi:hypothetical protein
VWSYTSTPPIRIHGVVVKHRDNFNFMPKNHSKMEDRYIVDGLNLLAIWTSIINEYECSASCSVYFTIERETLVPGVYVATWLRGVRGF